MFFHRELSSSVLTRGRWSECFGKSEIAGGLNCFWSSVSKFENADLYTVP